MQKTAANSEESKKRLWEKVNQVRNGEIQILWSMRNAKVELLSYEDKVEDRGSGGEYFGQNLDGGKRRGIGDARSRGSKRMNERVGWREGKSLRFGWSI